VFSKISKTRAELSSGDCLWDPNFQNTGDKKTQEIPEGCTTRSGCRRDASDQSNVLQSWLGSGNAAFAMLDQSYPLGADSAGGRPQSPGTTIGSSARRVLEVKLRRREDFESSYSLMTTEWGQLVRRT
jgi:hypothetical protein